MRILDLSFDATERCNRMCDHCSAESTMEGENFTLGMAQELAEAVAKESYDKVCIGITGGGELLLNPQIVGITDTFLRVLGNSIAYFQIVTSGVLPGVEEEEKRLKDLLSLPYPGQWGRIVLTLSFNLYNPTFPTRLANSIKLAHVAGCESICFNVAMSEENVSKTHEALLDVLESLRMKDDFGIRHYMVDESTDEVQAFLGADMFVRKKWGAGRFEWLKEFTLTFPTTYFGMDSEGRMARYTTHPISFFPDGRGANINETPWATRALRECLALDEMKKRGRHYLHVNAKGVFFPTCECGLVGNPPLGVLGEPISKILRRKRQFFSGFMGRVITAPDLESICEICKRLTAA